MDSEQTPPVEAVIEDRAIDSMRPLRVICIGAGISGMITAIRFPQRIPNLELQLYEKNSEIGGTWFENRYPGCACDIPAHTYQLTFEPNLKWSQFYAQGPEILQYWKTVARKYDCMKYVKLQHKVLEARWNAEDSKWHVKVLDLASGKSFTDACDVLISAAGALNEWKWPVIPGLHSFKGKLLHSANWDQDYNYSNKRVAVIGSGSSAIQIVPGIQKAVTHIDHYVRGKTWIATNFAGNKVTERGAALENIDFLEDDFKSFEDPEVYQKFRKDIEKELQSAHSVTLRGSPAQAAALVAFTANMKNKLAAKPSVLAQLMPSFPPVCRRLTPGPGYLEALTADNVDVISEPIVEIVPKGIITIDGRLREVDAIACATGFDTTFTGRFPIIGKNGVTLAEKWKDVPETYISLAVDEFPNYFTYLGPNSGVGTGNLIVLLEKMGDYFTDCLLKIQRDNIREMEVKRDAVKGFVEHCDKYFLRTVFSMKCRSWYKGGKEEGRVNALWPGSSLHAMQALKNPRWEDYNFNYAHDNRFGWFGDGWTVNEKEDKINVDYLDDENIDFPPATLIEREESKEVNGGLVKDNGVHA